MQENRFNVIRYKISNQATRVEVPSCNGFSVENLSAESVEASGLSNPILHPFLGAWGAKTFDGCGGRVSFLWLAHTNAAPLQIDIIITTWG